LAGKEGGGSKKKKRSRSFQASGKGELKPKREDNTGEVEDIINRKDPKGCTRAEGTAPEPPFLITTSDGRERGKIARPAGKGGFGKVGREKGKITNKNLEKERYKKALDRRYGKGAGPKTSRHARSYTFAKGRGGGIALGSGGDRCPLLLKKHVKDSEGGVF